MDVILILALALLLALGYWVNSGHPPIRRSKIFFNSGHPSINRQTLKLTFLQPN
jgi:hypothetical protein